MIQGAIFDVDGTLLDSMYAWRTVGEKYLRSLEIQPREDLWATFKTLTLDQAALYFQDQYGVPFSQEQIMNGINHLVENMYFQEVQLRPGIGEFLEKLKKSGVKMGIATATDRYLVEAALMRCGILSYFGDIVTCREAGSKRNPRIYETALSRLRTPKEETWVFEDAYHGAKTASEAGFPVLGIMDPSEENQQGLQAVSTVYLKDFQHTESFWKTVCP